MKKGLTIENDELVYFKRSIKEVGFDAHTKKFRVRIKDIKIIALSPRMNFDDEIILVTLIDNNLNYYCFSYFEFGSPALDKLEQILKLSKFAEVGWKSFPSEDFNNSIDTSIIYPQELFMHDLFKKYIIQKDSLLDC